MNFKRLTVLIVCLVFVGTTVFMTWSEQAFAAEDTNYAETQTGWFQYAPHAEGDLQDIYIYDDDWFNGSAYEYDSSLATMSMLLAAGSISSQAGNGRLNSRNINDIFDKLGFVSFECTDYYDEDTEENNLAVSTAYKVIKDENGEESTLLAVIPRSAGYGREWSGNFNVGDDGLHEGFEIARDIVIAFVKDYVANHKEEFPGKVKLWTVGYSRGAATANLFGGFLAEDARVNGGVSDELGVSIAQEDMFVYTFGTPNGVYYTGADPKANYNKDYERAVDTGFKYGNIFNAFARYDIVSMAAFDPWGSDSGFTRYGWNVDYIELAGGNDAGKNKMLQFLKRTSPEVYEIYTSTPDSGNNTADPDAFIPMKLKIGNGIGFEYDSDPNAAIDQEEFLKERLVFLTEELVPTRNDYTAFWDSNTNVSYQQGICALLSLWYGMNGAESEAFMRGLTSDKTQAAITIVLLLAYYDIDRYLPNSGSAMEQAEFKEFIDKIEIFAGKNADALGLSQEELEMLAFILEQPEMADVTEKAKAFFKNAAENALGNLLESGIENADLNGKNAEAAYRVLVNKAPVTKFITYFLFGSDDGDSALGDVLSLDSPQTKAAATLLYNSGRYMRVHNNEIIVSWLRVNDPLYMNNNAPNTDLWVPKEQEGEQEDLSGTETLSEENETAEAVDTGDDSNMLPWILLAGFAVLAGTGTAMFRRKLD